MIVELFKYKSLGKAAMNRELTKLYDELRPGFVATMLNAYNQLRNEDAEELFNDALLVFYKQVSSGELQQLTCSIKTYVYTIGRNKAVDLLRKRHHEVTLYKPVVDYGTLADRIWDEQHETDRERQQVAESIVRRMTEPCRRILFMFYYEMSNMLNIAKELGYASADVAKTKKNVCLTKAKTAARDEMKRQGL